MKTSLLLVRVQHKEPLPDNIAKLLQDRIYWVLYSRGVEAGVQVTIEKPLQVREQGNG